MKLFHKNTDPQEQEAQRKTRVWRLLSRLVALWLKKFHNTQEQVPVEGPFLLIANHASNLDPVYVAFSSPRRPYAFVASEHLLRLGFVTWLLTRYFTVIPRPKASMAIDTIRSIKKTLKQGDPVVLFAEGDNTWTGVSGSIFPATGKLVKMMKVPLVTYRLEGNFLTKPRWADKKRPGFVRGSVVHVYQPEEIAKMRPEEIDRRINADIYVDIRQFPQADLQRFKGRHLAEHVERGFFICPSCGRIGTLSGHGNRILCGGCGSEMTIDAACRLHGGPFADLYAWEQWQSNALRTFVQEQKESRLFVAEGGLTDLTQEKQEPVSFWMDLSKQALCMGDRQIQFSEISDMSMVQTTRLLFTTDQGYFEIHAKRAVLRPYVLVWQEVHNRME